MKKLFGFVLALASALVLTACGGGHDPVPGAASNLTVAINPETGPATTRSVVNQPFVFSSGVPAFGTTSTTTLVFTNTSTTPAFSISADGNTATGVTTFGSCRFNVDTSSFDEDSALAAGKTVVISNCQLRVNTAGTPANGVPRQLTATLVLGGAASNAVTVTVTIDEDGTVMVGSVVIGTVVIRDLTGG